MDLNARFASPASLHPTLSLTVPSSSVAPSDNCLPYLLLTLPPPLFLDPYQFAVGANIVPSAILQIDHIGPVELERAVGWSLPAPLAKEGVHQGSRQWNGNLSSLPEEHTAVLLRLKLPKKASVPDLYADSSTDAGQDLSIPLHARYMPPVHSGQRYWHVDLPAPQYFWACDAASGGDLHSSEYMRPEDLLPPPWSHLLSSIPLPPSSTHIYRPASFISSSSNKDALRISIPTGDATLGFPTQLITVLAVLAAAVWVANVTRRVLNSVASVEREAEKGKYRRVDRLKGE